jgi:hypothetical protein
VQVYFETGDRTNAPLAASDFPLPQTCWVRYFLGEGQRLTTDVPTASAGGDAWRSAVGVGDQVDGVHYLLDFDQPTAICGPVTVTLWMTSTTVDTDVYAMLADVDPSGTIQMLQRGLLRASHRALDEQASLWLSVDGQRTLVRPRHTHQQPQPLEPGRPCRIDVEIFPVGHVFRPGHRLGLWLSQPPQGDPVTRHRDGRPAYQYESAQPPSTVTVWRSREYPSSILLPLQPTLPPISATPPGPGEQAGVHVKE